MEQHRARGLFMPFDRPRDRIMPNDYFYVCFPFERRPKEALALALKWLPVLLEWLSSGAEHLSEWLLLPPSNMSRITRLGVTSHGIEGHEKGLRFPVVHERRLKSSSLPSSFSLRILFLALSEKFSPEYHRVFAHVFRSLGSVPVCFEGKLLLSTRLTRL